MARSLSSVNHNRTVANNVVMQHLEGKIQQQDDSFTTLAGAVSCSIVLLLYCLESRQQNIVKRSKHTNNCTSCA